jgi:hypothetical protein
MALGDILVSSIFQIARTLRLTRIFSIVGSKHRFSDYFTGMEKVQAIRDTFGERTEEVLNGLKVELTWVGGYMWVNNIDGHLMVSAKYLNDGDKLDVYLDHQTVHGRQGAFRLSLLIYRKTHRIGSIRCRGQRGTATRAK